MYESHARPGTLCVCLTALTEVPGETNTDLVAGVHIYTSQPVADAVCRHVEGYVWWMFIDETHGARNTRVYAVQWIGWLFGWFFLIQTAGVGRTAKGSSRGGSFIYWLIYSGDPYLQNSE